MIIKKKQGDSIWIDLVGDNVPEVDSAWDNWSGSWAISSTIGGAALASGSLTKDSTVTGLFKLRIGTSVTSALTVGDYYLIVQVDNTTVDYRQEILQAQLRIQTQGITP